jgi:CDP-diacylglycerol---glycerol-3-phosphate 3-phosphatidyltransferase
VGIYQAKPAFQRALRPIERALVARGVHPDAVTLSALAVSVAGGVALALSTREPVLLLAVPIVGLTRTALNALDGMVARASGRARPWGEVLNETCDRLSDIALFGGLALAGSVDLRLAAAAVVAMLVASHAGVLAKAVGTARVYDGPMGKADRMALLGVASVAALPLPPRTVFTALFAALLVGSVATAAQRLSIARRRLVERDQRHG